MEVTVEHTIETVSGKEYPLTITRQHGVQEIEVDGETVKVTDVTLFDSPLGHSRCFTRWRPPMPPEEREAVIRRIKEVATQAMIDQGIW